jgi:entericidin B
MDTDRTATTSGGAAIEETDRLITSDKTKRIATIALFVLTLAGAASMLSACNTMEGAGQDIQRGGKALEDSAERNK